MQEQDKPNFQPYFRTSSLNRLNLLVIVGILATGLGLSFFTRSYAPFVAMVCLMLAFTLIPASATVAVATLRSKRAWDDFSLVHICITAVTVGFLILGLAGAVERLVWFNVDHIPSVLVAKDYGNHYTANNHRLFKMVCEARGVKGPLMIQEIDDRAYVRCGDWYPQVYTIATTKTAFEQALRETANDPPGMPVVIEPNEK